MVVKIGFIGTNELERLLNKVCTDIKDVQLTSYFYNSELESQELVERAERQNDVLLFGGPVPYKIVTQAYTLRKPSVTLTFDEAALYRAFLKAIIAMKSSDLTLSVDTISNATIKQVVSDGLLNETNVYLYSKQNELSEKLIDYHETLYNQGKTTIALTGLRSTYLQLRKKEIPSILILTSEASLREAINKCLLLHQSETFRKAQIVVGTLRCHHAKKPSENYSLKKLQLEIHHLLLTYAQTIHAALFLLDNLNFSFYTTRGMIEKQSIDVFYNLVKNIEQLSPLTVQVGLGIGNSAQQAYSKASIALDYCKSENQHCCYLVNSQDKVKNLLENTNHVDWFRVDEEWVKSQSEKFNVSPLILARLSNITKRLEKNTFTAEEIARELTQSIRNSRRILNLFEEKGLAKMVGEEHYNGKGRPKRVYKLLF